MNSHSPQRIHPLRSRSCASMPTCISGSFERDSSEATLQFFRRKMCHSASAATPFTLYGSANPRLFPHPAALNFHIRNMAPRI